MRIPEMMKRRLRRGEAADSATTTSSSSSSSAAAAESVEWEMRPGGMLVQKRSESAAVDLATPNLRIRVVYGAVSVQISANAESTFGELKKLLTAETGLQPAEQRLIFRGKERENGEYLDTCGVKDRSKVLLIDDPESKERRMVEMRRKAKIETIQRLIDNVSTEIDRLVEQVDVIEKSIANGKRVAELQITTLIEMLMQQAVKLDNIPAAVDGERVQKCVEKLDVLKVQNAKQKVPPSVVTSTLETFEPSYKWELFD
ncbi:BAG family molecular chaperone regulator 2-like isoform X2 [Salvia splendens]|uniref:BAG family molecular chaperone regulator 2-like isoform X2 n=1 Tax=Salvia splendens TaxID=180675 RepID=UPI001C253C72|nr:BAG family molecular chaperone regulator 2-like isoform X2 [Salvia splendens]